MPVQLYHQALHDFGVALGDRSAQAGPEPLTAGDAATVLRHQLVALCQPRPSLQPRCLALAVAQVAAQRSVTTELLPGLAALQRAAQLRHLARGDADALALAAALDHASQIVRNSLSLLKELALGTFADAEADQLLWQLALHAQTRCSRGPAGLAADGLALANLASALQMVERVLLRHGLQRSERPAQLGGAVLDAYQNPQTFDALEVGLQAVDDSLLLAQWLRGCAQGVQDG